MGFFKPFDMPTGAVIPDREIDIRTLGAVEGGQVKNTAVIRAAIDTLAEQGGGRVVIPAGRWLTGPIRFRSGIELHLERGCEVLFSTDKEDYLPAVFTLYEGMRCYTYAAQLYAHQCHDIAVTGEGTFNGQGFVWWYMAAMYREGVQDLHDAGESRRPVEQRVYDTEAQGLRPGLLHFVDCQNVLIEGCTFKFSPFWTVHPTWCENIIVRNIRVCNPYDHAPNTDGCNLEGCKRGLVDGIWADTGDDAVCLKAGRDEDGRQQNRPCEDIVLRNIVANRSHGGITIGSEMSSGVRNIYVDSCEFLQNFIGIWIKTAPERGGYVRDVEFHNIKIGKLRHQGICFTMGYYVDDYAPDDFPHMPVVENILVEDFSCEYAGVAVKIEGCQNAPMRNIRLKNVTATGGVNVETAHVSNLCMENVNFI